MVNPQQYLDRCFEIPKTQFSRRLKSGGCVLILGVGFDMQMVALYNHEGPELLVSSVHEDILSAVNAAAGLGEYFGGWADGDEADSEPAG